MFGINIKDQSVNVTRKMQFCELLHFTTVVVIRQSVEGNVALCHLLGVISLLPFLYVHVTQTGSSASPPFTGLH